MKIKWFWRNLTFADCVFDWKTGTNKPKWRKNWLTVVRLFAEARKMYLKFWNVKTETVQYMDGLSFDWDYNHFAKIRAAMSLSRLLNSADTWEFNFVCDNVWLREASDIFDVDNNIAIVLFDHQKLQPGKFKQPSQIHYVVREMSSIQNSRVMNESSTATYNTVFSFEAVMVLHVFPLGRNKVLTTRTLFTVLRWQFGQLEYLSDYAGSLGIGIICLLVEF